MSRDKVGTSWRNKSGRSIPEACDDGEAQDGYQNEGNSFSGLNFSNRSWADICDEDSQKTLEPEKDHLSLLIQDDSTLGPISMGKDHSVVSSVTSKSEVHIFSSHSGLMKGVFSDSETIKTEFRSDMKPVAKKRKESELILNEDSLSLSSHFDVIKMESPCKAQDTTPTKQLRSRSPIYCDEATVTSPYRLKRRVPLKESLSDDNQPMDDALPSPSKISKRETQKEKSHSTPSGKRYSTSRHQDKSHSSSKEKSHSTPKDKHSKSKTPKTPRTPRESEVSEKTSKRKRVDSLPNTPGSGGKQRLELETDEEVLFRRQKQLDYGKNTAGYERYLEMVPKETRSKDHPKTPPKQLKYSRRAWDGLVRTWRKRLHYWDVPNEDGTMPEYMDDYSSLSEQSSCDESMSVTESLPTTPMQDWKRRVRTRRDSESSDCSSSMTEDECHPLPGEDIRV